MRGGWVESWRRWLLRRAIRLVLSSKDGYDIVSAIRGPDIYRQGLDMDCLPSSLKLATTARIRALVGVKVNDVDINHTPLSLEMMEHRDRRLDGKDAEHFRCHYQAAVNAIRRLYGYDLWIEKDE
jgi:hypothetical protein